MTGCSKRGAVTTLGPDKLGGGGAEMHNGSAKSRDDEQTDPWPLCTIRLAPAQASPDIQAEYDTIDKRHEIAAAVSAAARSSADTLLRPASRSCPARMSDVPERALTSPARSPSCPERTVIDRTIREERP